MASSQCLQFSITLASGRCERVSVPKDGGILELRIAAQRALSQGFLRLFWAGCYGNDFAHHIFRLKSPPKKDVELEDDSPPTLQPNIQFIYNNVDTGLINPLPPLPTPEGPEDFQ